MSRNNLQVINNYVSPEIVGESMFMGELSKPEFSAAVDGVCISRAQFVVDAALAELNGRLPGLHEKRQGILRRLSRTEDDIDIVRDELAKARGVDLAEDADISLWADQNNALHLLKLFEATTKKQFLELIIDEPPFSVWVRPNNRVESIGHVNDKTHPLYLRKLTQVLPNAAQSVGRAASIISDMKHASDPEFTRCASFHTYKHPDTGFIGIEQVKVEKPKDFFARAFKIKDFGLQSAKVILGGAYAQREELEQK
jgi:hypothetical protein